ncbi:hypothetical protein BDZ91DRAFT_716842 [Kalaharituber pfeilii]|nr:hypothetical protein BDZ91DRAFT_716842 [Kalaharituber pfeilii]
MPSRTRPIKSAAKQKRKNARAPKKVTQTIAPEVEPTFCPAETCHWQSTAKDRHRALRRHIHYIINWDPKKKHPQHYWHLGVYKDMWEQRASNPQKLKEAQKKYRENNRAKRSEAARLSYLRRKIRATGVQNKAEIDRQAKELMIARKK